MGEIVQDVNERRKPYAGTQSVRRALALLGLFDGPEPELALAELRERAGLNRSTAFRLLTALEAEGMVERNPATDRYRLGSRIAALGARVAGRRDLGELAQPEMDALARTANETITLEVLVDGGVRIIAEAVGGRVFGTLPSVGTTWPAHATSTGKVLLASLGPEERARLLRGRRRRWTEHTLTRRAELEGELARAAREGFAVSIEELERAYVAVGVPVHGDDGRVVAALSAGGPRERLSRRRLEELARELQAAAGRISARLRAA